MRACRSRASGSLRSPRSPSPSSSTIRAITARSTAPGHGQWDAARSTGLKARQALIYVVLPQAVRNVLPDLISNTVEVVKLTSLASVVALPEMLYSADMARSLTYNASPIVLAAAIYLVLLWPVVRLVSRMEHRVGH